MRVMRTRVRIRVRIRRIRKSRDGISSVLVRFLGLLSLSVNSIGAMGLYSGGRVMRV
jgi:hypothetical protein